MILIHVNRAFHPGGKFNFAQVAGDYDAVHLFLVAGQLASGREFTLMQRVKTQVTNVIG